MSKFNGHTPLPWSVDNNGETIFIRSSDQSGLFHARFSRGRWGTKGKISVDEVSSSSNFIVHACNTYYEREEELAKAKALIAEAVKIAETFELRCYSGLIKSKSTRATLAKYHSKAQAFLSDQAPVENQGPAIDRMKE